MINMIKYAAVSDIRCLKRYVSRRRTSKVSRINRSSERVGIKRWKGKDKFDKSVTDLSSSACLDGKRKTSEPGSFIIESAS